MSRQIAGDEGAFYKVILPEIPVLDTRPNGARLLHVIAAGREWNYGISQPKTTEKTKNTMKRKASAVWQGGLKDGRGTISTGSGVLQKTQYSFGTRFEEGIGTNPEELIAAAHAGCFSMALSGQLGAAGMVPESIETAATVSLDQVDGAWEITTVHLDVTVHIPGADQAAFDTAAQNAKAGCPVSKLLKAEITMAAQLVS